MPVAMSISDTANSAAQFIYGAAKGDAASRGTSQAADANNSAVNLISQDRKSNDEDFDAVLALLLNGGVPPMQQPAVQLKVATNVAESGTSDATIEIAESSIVPGVSLASTPAATITSLDFPLNSANVDDAPTATMQAGQGSAPS